MKDEYDLADWVNRTSRINALTVALRSSLRFFPVLARVGSIDPEYTIAIFRGMSAAWLFSIEPKREEVLRLELQSAAEFLAKQSSNTLKDKSLTSIERMIYSFSDASIARMQVAEMLTQSIKDLQLLFDGDDGGEFIESQTEMLSKEIRSLDDGYPTVKMCCYPIWLVDRPGVFLREWNDLKDELLEQNRNWEVWTSWFDDRIHGRPFDRSIDFIRHQIPKYTWHDGAELVNNKIIEDISEYRSREDFGNKIEYNPEKEAVVRVLDEIDDADALENALSQVEDAIEDLKMSPLGNQIFLLNPVLSRIGRTIEKYRDNPRRVHDEFFRAARDISDMVECHPELDHVAVRDLRDVCGQGVIDLRISVVAVAEMEAKRRKRIARAPSASSQSATKRLLSEIGRGLDESLLEEFLDDFEIVSIASEQNESLPQQSEAHEAMLRISARLGWLHRFSRSNEGRIAAIADKLSTNVQQVERMVDLFRGAEGWWAVIEWLLKVV